jgi:hypothetical protein
MNKVKGEKVEEYIKNMENGYFLKLREYLYDFIKIIEKNNLNNNGNIENQNEENNHNIQSYNNLKEKIIINLNSLNFLLLKITFNNINFVPFIYLNNPYNYNKSFEKNDLLIQFLQLINIRENIPTKNLVRSKSKYKINIIRQIIEETKSINDYINEYINNDLKETHIKKKQNEKVPPHIYFNCKESIESEFAEINIKLYIFDIYIKIPFNKFFNLINFYNKFIFTIKKIDPYSFQKENNNYPKKLLKIDDFENLLLIKYIKDLYKTTSYIIIKMIIMKIKEEEKRIPLVGKEVLIEFCKRFIYYIRDYDNLFTIKCSLCGKSAKFSLKEKCFFPPYYKIYREKEEIDIINKETRNPINLFYHVECFKKLDYPY